MHKLEKWYPWLIVFFVVLAYQSSFQGVFLFDDYKVILNNPAVKHFFPISLNSRIVADLTFKLNYLISGTNVADYHMVNLLIHVLASLFLFGFIRRTFMLSQIIKKASYGDDIAFLSSVAWAVHPLNTQGVTYICQRYESFMGLFFFAALYTFARGVTSKRSRLWGLASIGFCLIGMGVKEEMATAPLMILLYDYAVVTGFNGGSIRERAGFHVASFLTIGVFALLQLSLSTTMLEHGLVFSRMSNMSPIRYFVTQFGVIGHYLRLAIFPNNLCFDYMWPESKLSLTLALQGGMLLLFALFSIWSLIKRRVWGYFGVWFFVALAPTSSFLPIADTAFEHRMYLPLAGLIPLFVISAYLLASRVLGKVQKKGLRFCLFAGWMVIVLTLTYATWIRNSLYHSEESIWKDVTMKCPNNIRGQNELLRVLAQEDRVADAMIQYQSVLDLIPERVRAEIEAGTRIVGDTFNMQSYEYFYYVANANMGIMLSHKTDFTNSLKYYSHALKVDPLNEKVIELIRNGLKKKGLSESEINIEIERILKVR